MCYFGSETGLIVLITSGTNKLWFWLTQQVVEHILFTLSAKPGETKQSISSVFLPYKDFILSKPATAGLIETGLCFYSDLPPPPSDRHLSATIRASGCLCLHVVPITPDHEVVIGFNCYSSRPPGTLGSVRPWITSGYMCRVMTG